MKPAQIALLLLLTTWLAPLSLAKFAQPLVELVPTTRLINNLEKQLAANPASSEKATLHYELGRVHSIAAHKAPDQFPTLKSNGHPSFGVGPSKDLPPDHRRQDGNNQPPTLSESARTHLKSAITHYQAALKLKPDHLPTELGLAWCLDLQGNKPEAIQHYRKALALAWDREEKSDGIFHLSWVEEIAGYLEPLLDPVRDAAELKRIKHYREVITHKPRAITPLLIPVGSSIELDTLIDPNASVAFDLDGSGLDRRWGWITPRAAWIVYDPEQRGQITSGLQLIGNVTFWIFWNNGYAALAALDNNQDQSLTADELDGLALWRDTNGDGISDPGEVVSLQETGVLSLSTQWTAHETGIPYSPKGVVYRDGRVQPSYDWLAPMNPRHKKPREPMPVPGL